MKKTTFDVNGALETLKKWDTNDRSPATLEALVVHLRAAVEAAHEQRLQWMVLQKEQLAKRRERAKDDAPPEMVRPSDPLPLDDDQVLFECPRHRGDNCGGDALFMRRNRDKEDGWDCPACRHEEWSNFYERNMNRIYELLCDDGIHDFPTSVVGLMGRARVAGEVARLTLKYVGAGLPENTPVDIFDQDNAAATTIAEGIKKRREFAIEAYSESDVSTVPSVENMIYWSERVGPEDGDVEVEKDEDVQV